MVRASIARQLGSPPHETVGPPSPRGGFSMTDTPYASRHAAFLRLPLASGGDDDDGACLIEPSVRCNHCGYCQSYGH